MLYIQQYFSVNFTFFSPQTWSSTAVFTVAVIATVLLLIWICFVKIQIEGNILRYIKYICSNIVMHFLMAIPSTSLYNKKIPKVSEIEVLLHKKRELRDMKSYHSKTLLSVVCKMFLKTVTKKIASILYSNQCREWTNWLSEWIPYYRSYSYCELCKRNKWAAVVQ